MVEVVHAQDSTESPVLQVLRERGSTVTWLARRIKKNRTHTSLVVHGRRQGSEDFWQACADALGLPIEKLHSDSPTTSEAA